jgi:hypothetical protein
MYRHVGGFCAATIVFVCGVAGGVPGFPVPPDTKPAAHGPVVVLLEGSPVVRVPAGSVLRVEAGGFAGGARVTVALYSSPEVVATVVADAAGEVSADVRVPSGVAGEHTLVAVGNARDRSARALEATITILDQVRAPLAVLPVTGFRAAWMTLAGALMLILGFGLVRTAAARRRLLPER